MTLLFTEKQQPTYWNWDAINAGNREIEFRLDRNLVRKFAEVIVQSKNDHVLQNLWHFDIFLLHEVFHACQSLKHGVHKKLKRQAPAILSSMDHEADTLAVTTLFPLILKFPELFYCQPSSHGEPAVCSAFQGACSETGQAAYWKTMAQTIHAQIGHLNVFTASMVDTNKPAN